MNKHNLFIFNSKKKFVFILKLFLLFISVFCFCYHVMPQYEESYNASLCDKVERLESIDEPKIVLLGNSNVAFGFESELIEESFGMPVVNMGLHAGLGNAFHENMAKLNVVNGDIYILCHTQFTDDNKILDPVLAWTTVENHLELWKIFRKEDIFPMFLSYPTYLKRCLYLYANEYGNKDDGTVYSRCRLNEYGDVDLERFCSYTHNANSFNAEINDQTIERINELNEYLEERGATLLVAAYPIATGEMICPKEEVVAFQYELENKLDYLVISNYADYVMDEKYFYDTGYHLTTEGAEIRTKLLIDELKNWLECVQDQ